MALGDKLIRPISDTPFYFILIADAGKYEDNPTPAIELPIYSDLRKTIAVVVLFINDSNID
jgi:hypothetical protein